jgi:hypothetical protein
MQNPITNTAKIDARIVTDRDLTTVSTSLLDNRDPVKTVPVAAMSRWQKSLAVISVGVGMTMMAVTTVEYPGQATFRRSLDRQPPQAIPVLARQFSSRETAPTNVTPLDRSLAVATGSNPERDREARIATAQAAVAESKVALALSQADVAQAHINVQTFKNDYDRHQDLFKSGAVNSQKLVRARIAYDFAKRQKSHAVDGLKQVQVQLNAAAANVAKVQAQSRASGSCSRSQT